MSFPIRTGLGSPGVTSLYPNDEYLIKRAMALAGVATQRAADTACTLAEHQGRRGRGSVSVPHLHAGLMFQARTLMTSDGLEEEVEAIYRVLEASTSDDDDASVVSSVDGIDMSSDDEASSNTPPATLSDSPDPPPVLFSVEEAVAGECGCALCAGARETVRTWSEWAPTDEVEKYLKHVIDTKILI